MVSCQHSRARTPKAVMDALSLGQRFEAPNPTPTVFETLCGVLRSSADLMTRIRPSRICATRRDDKLMTNPGESTPRTREALAGLWS